MPNKTEFGFLFTDINLVGIVWDILQKNPFSSIKIAKLKVHLESHVFKYNYCLQS